MIVAEMTIFRFKKKTSVNGYRKKFMGSMERKVMKNIQKIYIYKR